MAYLSRTELWVTVFVDFDSRRRLNCLLGGIGIWYDSVNAEWENWGEASPWALKLRDELAL